MGVLVKKQRGIYSFTGMGKLAIITFLVSMGYALIDTVWAIYLQSIFHNISIVSFISALFTLVAFLAFFFLIPIIERNNKAKLFKMSLFLIGLSYIIFYLSRNIFIFFIAAFVLVIFTSLRINSFGIIIRDKSSNKCLARNEGLLYTFFNIAWLVGPLIAGAIANAYGVPLVFLLSSLFIFLSLFIFHLSKVNDANISKKIDGSIVKNFVSYFKNRDRVFAYILGGGVNFWLILIYLYMPIYILQSGLNDLWIGYFLFAFAFPPVLLEYYASKIAGKIGFKKIFKTGFLILSFSALICYFLNNIYLIMACLVFASIGVAMIEPTTEAYFFDILKKKEDESKYYGPYNTTIDTNHFVGSVLAGIILLFFPFKNIFLFFAFFMLVYFLVCFKMRDINESNIRNAWSNK
jgi:MFS family permease